MELSRQTYPHGLIEVVIVDDASAEPVSPVVDEAVKKLSDFSRLNLVRHERNRGRAATRNSGITNSSGELLIFNDVDDFPDPDYITQVVTRHAQPCIAVRGNIRVLPELRARSAYLRFRDSRFLGARRRQERDNTDYENLPPCLFATSGSSVMRSDLLGVGLFDERFTGYGGEDEEMGYRLFQSGVRIVFEERARLWDGDYTTTLERTCERYRNYGKLGAALLFAMHPGYRRYTSLHWHEPIDPRWDSAKVRLIKRTIRCLLHPSTAKLLQKWLQAMDGLRLPWNPPGLFYQYVLRACYQQGVLERYAQVVAVSQKD
jgi:glycosyltransferase involved in cell wall biosynthesis